MIIFTFFLLTFAVYRVTRIIADEDGPFDFAVNFRHFLKSNKYIFFYKLTDCFYCLSMWISVPAAFLMTTDVKMWFIYWLALSGLSCIIYTQTEK